MSVSTIGVLGLGLFGSAVARTLAENNVDVIAIDKNMDHVEEVLDEVPVAIQGDFTKIDHLMEAGFDVDIATISGYPVKLELWAMPNEDEAVLQTYEKLKAKLKQPKVLSDVIKNDLGSNSDYLSVFIPGGHGAVVGISESKEVQKTLDWALEYDKFIITLCHGPAALLSASMGRKESPFKGYSVCVFPDALDEGANLDIGYLPGK